MTLIVSCSKDPIPINVVTTVVEYAIDSTKNNKRLANVLVEILGCTQGAYSQFCKDSITNTRTDENGEFKISFNSDGKSVGFIAQINNRNNDILKNNSVRLTPGITNTIVLKAIKKTCFKTHLKILKNPYDSILYFSDWKWQTFYGFSIDTFIVSKANYINRVSIKVFDTDSNKYRIYNDNVFSNSNDTTYHQVAINNTKEMDFE